MRAAAQLVTVYGTLLEAGLTLHLGVRKGPYLSQQDNQRRGEGRGGREGGSILV
jgi:hypothetical protein